MAASAQVRQYLAYWFQLGKQVVVGGGKETLLPQPVIQGDRYSAAFERCWQRVSSAEAGDCYLEGTDQTIAELLSPAWEIQPCARCAMPVPLPNLGVRSPDCPCSDLSFWPDSSMPLPRSPVNSQAQLAQIRDRLMNPQRDPSQAS